MLKELEDYNWFPAGLRRWQMEYIGYAVCLFKLYQPLVQVLEEMISGNRSVVLQDTCSGSGMPAMYVYNRLSSKLPVMLTDKYPYSAFKNAPLVMYSAFTADITRLHPSKGTLYTMYNAFHHFSGDEQKGIVNKMAENGSPFLIAEILEPGVLTFIKVIFTTTILQLLTAPFVKPFSLKRLLFTYIIPVNIFTVTYDGIVSVLKSASARQYRKLFAGISTNAYTVTVNKVNRITGTVIYIKGEPV